MTKFVEMGLLWAMYLAIFLVVLYGFFCLDFEFGIAFDPLAEIVWDSGEAVPQLVLKHTSNEWRIEHNCVVDYPCQASGAAWYR